MMNIKTFIALITIAWLTLANFAPVPAASVGAGPGPSTVPKIPSGHPRVYLRPADLPALRAKIIQPEFQKTWASVRASQDPACRAFVYLLTGDKAAGREAIEKGLHDLQTQKDGRPFFHPMHKAACIYDWCYDLLRSADKQAYIAAFRHFAAGHTPGYPPNPKRLNPLVGHDNEGWILTGQLPAGVAIWDEDPRMYEQAARLFFDFYVEPRNFFYPAHMQHQGTHYSGERFIHDQACSWLFRRLGAGDVLSREQHFVPYHLLYNLRPDKFYLKDGDDNDDIGVSFNKRLAARLSGTYYADPWLLTFSDFKQFETTPFLDIFDLLFLDSAAPRAPLSDLPLTKYFGSPMGDMVTRTGWQITPDSRDAVIRMRIGEYYFGNHQHRDFGTFQIYYRGPLAIATGIYQGNLIEDSNYGTPHWSDYYQQTVAQNGLMIFDPASAAKDFGGQRAPVNSHPGSVKELKAEGHWAEVTGHACGPDPAAPDFSYLAGDISHAYLAAKASRVTRAMVALNTHRKGCPAALVVYDQVACPNPVLKKAFYLHSIQEPRIEGRRATIIRTGPAFWGGLYGGQLVMESLLPAAAQLVKVGGPGRECWNEVTQRNYPSGKGKRPTELGAWRVEVIPATPSARDEFLTVMSAMDVGQSAPPVVRISSGELAGACLFDRVVLFNRTERPLERAEFDLPAGGSVWVFVCGLKPGHWKIAGPDGTTRRLEASREGACLYFRAAPGRSRLTKE